MYHNQCEKLMKGNNKLIAYNGKIGGKENGKTKILNQK